MRKSLLDLLALAARLLEGLGAGQGTDPITHIFVKIAGNLARRCYPALGLQRAGRAVVLAGSVVDDVTLIDGSVAGELRATMGSNIPNIEAICSSVAPGCTICRSGVQDGYTAKILRQVRGPRALALI